MNSNINDFEAPITLNYIERSRMFESLPYDRSKVNIIYNKSELTPKQRKERAKSKRARKARRINRK